MESKEVDADFVQMTESELDHFCGKKPEEKAMWETNALIAAFETTGGSPEADSIDFAALKAAGIHAVLLRCGTSDNKLNYDEASASCIDDVRWRQWYKAASAAGLRVLIDYDFNPMIDSVNHHDGSVTLKHIDSLLSGGYKPAVGGGLFLNMERNTWYQGTALITCPAVNLGTDLHNIWGAIWNKYKLVAGVRSGQWFLDKTDEGKVTYRSQIPFIDLGEAAMPLFMARPKKTGVTVGGDFHELIANIPDPFTNTVNAPDGITKVNEQSFYLYFGNKTKWSGWEIAWVRHAAVKDATGCLALFRLILWGGDTKHFDAYFNFPAANADTTPPSVPAGLTSSVGGGTVILTWSPATDNVSVAGYQVYRGGAKVMATTGLSASFANQAPGVYVYGVSAFDAAGNESAQAVIGVTVTGDAPVTRAELEALTKRVAELEAQAHAKRHTHTTGEPV
jgi:hypothetical protein